MTRLLRTIAVVFVGALAASGCAFGHHHAYHLGSPAVGRGSSSVALSVADVRESVLMGGNPAFVGLSRAGFGNSFDVNTSSGQPLADDLATSIRRGLEAAGYRVTPVRVMVRAREETVVGALTRTGAERLLLFEISVWKSDTLMRTALDYDVTLRVFNAQGRQLARARVADRDVLQSESDIETIYVRKLERLLNDYAIKRALAPTPPPTPPPADASAVTPVPAS
jgi:hypothetical protein